MSLSLIQSYSSEEEEQEEEDLLDENHQDYLLDENHQDFSENVTQLNKDSYFPSTTKYNPIIAPKSSLLPSALDAFSEVSGPPQFLNNCVEDQSFRRDNNDVIAHQVRKKSRDKKDLPSGAMVEAKPNLVGIHERVRSDDGNSVQPQKTPSAGTKDDSQPRICLQCGIPTTYSSGLGRICPVCSGRSSDNSKNKGSTIKDKEKVKRMKGQSSHASWKSETEMHLRQQFD